MASGLEIFFEARDEERLTSDSARPLAPRLPSRVSMADWQTNHVSSRGEVHSLEASALMLRNPRLVSGTRVVAIRPVCSELPRIHIQEVLPSLGGLRRTIVSYLEF